MVQAWYVAAGCEDGGAGHKEPPVFASANDLFKSTGVEYYKINAKDVDTDPAVVNLKKQRGYSFEDEITIALSEEVLPDYEEKIRNFNKEHLHADEEVRLVVGGSAYFDVRDVKNEWIRIHLQVGDLIIIPSGLYHRLFLDNQNYIKLKRFFSEEPCWKAYYRPADDLECRKNYLKNLAQKRF